jgi:type I restriction enzyme M protein
MDASQYKDYVLFMLFIKYVSDKYGDSDDFAPPVTIPAGASFRDMIALKGKSDIGGKINTQMPAVTFLISTTQISLVRAKRWSIASAT